MAKSPSTCFKRVVIFEFKSSDCSVLQLHKLKDINQKTNVLSYFIIRYELYERLNTFLKFCNTINDNYITIKDQMKWLNFLKKNKKIIKNNRRFNQLDKKSFIFKTLRMSLNEKYIYADTN